MCRYELFNKTRMFQFEAEPNLLSPVCVSTSAPAEAVSRRAHKLIRFWWQLDLGFVPDDGSEVFLFFFLNLLYFPPVTSQLTLSHYLLLVSLKVGLGRRLMGLPLRKSKKPMVWLVWCVARCRIMFQLNTAVAFPSRASLTHWNLLERKGRRI